jgi:hypothetical protein
MGSLSGEGQPNPTHPRHRSARLDPMNDISIGRGGFLSVGSLFLSTLLSGCATDAKAAALTQTLLKRGGQEVLPISPESPTFEMDNPKLPGTDLSLRQFDLTVAVLTFNGQASGKEQADTGQLHPGFTSLANDGQAYTAYFTNEGVRFNINVRPASANPVLGSIDKYPSVYEMIPDAAEAILTPSQTLKGLVLLAAVDDTPENEAKYSFAHGGWDAPEKDGPYRELARRLGPFMCAVYPRFLLKNTLLVQRKVWLHEFSHFLGIANHNVNNPYSAVSPKNNITEPRIEWDRTDLSAIDPNVRIKGSVPTPTTTNAPPTPQPANRQLLPGVPQRMRP